MKLVIYIIIVVAWILISNYQKIQARKRKQNSGNQPTGENPDNDYQPGTEPKQKDLLEEILAQWTTNKPTVQASPKPVPVSLPKKQVKSIDKLDAPKPQLARIRYESLEDSSENKLTTSEIQDSEISSMESTNSTNELSDFNLKHAIIYNAILNRPEF